MAFGAVAVKGSATCGTVCVTFTTESVRNGVESTEAGCADVGVDRAVTGSASEVAGLVWKVTPFSVPEWVTLASSTFVLVCVFDTVFTVSVSWSVTSATHLSTSTLVD